MDFRANREVCNLIFSRTIDWPTLTFQEDVTESVRLPLLQRCEEEDWSPAGEEGEGMTRVAELTTAVAQVKSTSDTLCTLPYQYQQYQQSAALHLYLSYNLVTCNLSSSNYTDHIQRLYGSYYSHKVETPI